MLHVSMYYICVYACVSEVSQSSANYIDDAKHLSGAHQKLVRDRCRCLHFSTREHTHTDILKHASIQRDMYVYTRIAHASYYLLHESNSSSVEGKSEIARDHVVRHKFQPSSERHQDSCLRLTKSDLKPKNKQHSLCELEQISCWKHFETPSLATKTNLFVLFLFAF